MSTRNSALTPSETAVLRRIAAGETSPEAYRGPAKKALNRLLKAEVVEVAGDALAPTERGATWLGDHAIVAEAAAPAAEPAEVEAPAEEETPVAEKPAPKRPRPVKQPPSHEEEAAAKHGAYARPEGLLVPIATPTPAQRKRLGLTSNGPYEYRKVRDHAGVLHGTEQGAKMSHLRDDEGHELEVASWRPEAAGVRRDCAWFVACPDLTEMPESGTVLYGRYTVANVRERKAPAKAARKARPAAAEAKPAGTVGGRQGKVFEKYSFSAVARWMGLQGWTRSEAAAVFAALGIEPKSFGPMGNKKTTPATLTADEAAALSKLREAATAGADAADESAAA